MLVDPAFREENGSALVGALSPCAATIWDSLHLEELSEAANGRLMPVPAGFGVEITGQSACPVLELSYLAAHSGSVHAEGLVRVGAPTASSPQVSRGVGS